MEFRRVLFRSDGRFVSEAGKDDGIEGGRVLRNKLPHVNTFVGAGGEDVQGVGREGDGVEVALRLVQSVETHAIGDAPEFYGLIGAGGGENGAGWIESEIENGAVVDVDRAKEFAVGDLPEANNFVVASGGEHAAIGGKFGVVKCIAASAEFADERAGFQIVKLRDAIQAG